MKLFTYIVSTRIRVSNQNLRLVHFASLILTVCLLFLAPYRIATAQTVHIPDPGLRAALESALGKEAGDDITQAEMESLESLDAFKSGIFDLTGLEFATNLTELELRGNRVSDVSPLEDSTNLEQLRLGTNRKITDISPLKDLTNLKHLDIDSNDISDVSPLKNLTNLKWLDLDDNKISDVSPLITLTNLKYLDLDGNEILDVSPLKDLTNLIFLDVDDNGLSDVSPLSVLINLTVLDLDGNKISDVSPLSVLINLTVLDLHDNEISDVSPLSALINLTVLDLHNNEISDVSPLSTLTKLKMLDLSDNHISDFSPLAGLVGNLAEYDVSNQTLSTYKREDVNRDGIVNILDLVLAASNYDAPDFAALAGINIYPDVNSDGVVDIRDLVVIAAEIGLGAGAPTLSKKSVETADLTTENLAEWIRLAKQLDTHDPKTRKGLAVLEQLLAALLSVETLPRTTVLLLNYPNPFNPETWIPYQLSKPAAVIITIHGVDGKLIRTLELGYLSAGVYHGKSRAAYWDGRNELGESVASGIYFYTLITDDFTASRKMILRK